MSVFISYYRADEQIATEIHNFLVRSGVTVYLDKRDPALETTEDVTVAILAGLSMATHLLAVVSVATQKSWWVPFEIGVATQADNRICTFRLQHVSLPDYLKNWPVLSSAEDLDAFVQRYRADRAVLNETRHFEKTIIGTHSADEFHRSLMRDLGQ